LFIHKTGVKEACTWCDLSLYIMCGKKSLACLGVCRLD